MRNKDPHEIGVLYDFKDWFLSRNDPILERTTFWKRMKWCVLDIINDAIVEYISIHQIKETRDTEIKEVK